MFDKERFMQVPTMPKLQFGAGHPARNQKTHAALLDFLKEKMEPSKLQRDNVIQRYAETDRNVIGWIRMSADELKAAEKRRATGSPYGNKLNLPMALMQLDDAVAFYMQTFMPESGAFHGIGSNIDSARIGPITNTMNRTAEMSGYYRQLHSAFMSGLKHNLGSIRIAWHEQQVNVVSGQQGAEGSAVTLWSGNKIEAADPYNTFYDPAVNPLDLPTEGEYFGMCEMVSLFRLLRAAARGRYWGLDDLHKEYGAGNLNYAEYYVNPAEHIGTGPGSGGVDTGGAILDWAKWFGVATESGQLDRAEVTKVYAHVIPRTFNLIDAADAKNRKEFELWRFDILNGSKIIGATHINAAHGMLPMVSMVPYVDESGSMKSMAELLDPFQNFGSFLMNTHMEATRANIWGLTIYDPRVVDLSQIPPGTTSARVPAKVSGLDQDLSRSIYTDNKNLDTRQNMSDLGATFDLVERFMPVQANPGQIASIDRAVSSQVAAVQQGANRRLQKMARLSDEQALLPMRIQMLANMIQYGAEIEGEDGTSVRLEPKELSSLVYQIGMGLKMVEREAQAGMLQGIIDRVLQSKDAMQQLDVTQMMGDLAHMRDADISFSKYRIQQPGTTQQEGVPGGGPAAAPPAGAIVQP